jgi:hypothetical protein
MEQQAYETVLEEYRQLRDEIRTYLKSNDETKNYAIIITFGAFGIDQWIKYPQILFLAAFLICILWYNEIRTIKAIFRVAAYIQVFIEQELPDLKWETLGGRHKIQKLFFDRIISNLQLPLLIVFDFLFGIIFSLKIQYLQWLIWIVSPIFLFVIITLLIRSYSVARHGREKEVDYWIKQRQLNITLPNKPAKPQAGAVG